MNPVALILALITSAVGLGGFVFLMVTATGTCAPVNCMIGCILFLAGSVLAADNWVKAFGIKITGRTKIAH